jgi:branched-subunit amino acid aminotransferase/4-amino-4-deoxychorismate lyase
VWIDGELVPAERATVSLVDPAIQSGVGAFETLAVRDGQPLDWAAHLARLEDAARQLGFEAPNRKRLAEGAALVAPSVAGGCGWLKVIAVRGGPCAVFGASIDPT